MSVSLVCWRGEIGTNHFHKSLKMAPKTFEKCFSTPLEICYLFTLLLLLSYYSLRKKYYTLCFKAKYISKTFQQVLVSQQYLLVYS